VAICIILFEVRFFHIVIAVSGNDVEPEVIAIDMLMEEWLRDQSVISEMRLVAVD
jgi:hypothetical protein